MLEHALSFAARGWPVFPCIGKEPAVPKAKGGRGCLDATTDPTIIRGWWKRFPRANVALATGKASNTVVVDVDDGKLGVEELAKLGPLPKTLEVVTGSGSRHLFFERPAGEKKWGNTSKRLPHIDTRGDGGYVILPPSIHPETKKPYVFVDASAPLAPLPLVIIDAIYTAKERKPPTMQTRIGGIGPTYAEAALRDECRKVAGAGAGMRNDTLNIAAHSLGQLVGAGLLDEQDVRIELWNAAMTCGLEESETLKTIESGVSAGLKKPRQVELRAPSIAPAAKHQLRIVEPREPHGNRTEPQSDRAGEDPQGEDDPWQTALAEARADLLAQGLGESHQKTRRQLFTAPATSLFDREFPPTAWQVRGLITQGSVFVVAGEPKTTKTWAALELAMAISTKTKAFGEFDAPMEPQRVACFLVEDQPRATRNRLRALADSRGMDPMAACEGIYVENLVSLDLCDLEDLANIVASVRAIGGIGALVLDPLRDLHKKGENESDEMALVMGAMRALRSVLGCSIVFVHHSQKASKDGATRRAGQRMRGSTVVHGAIDGGLYLFDLTGNLETEWVNKAQGEVKAARSVGFFNLKLVVEDDDDGEALRAEWVFSKEGQQASEEDPLVKAQRRCDEVECVLRESSTPLSQAAIASILRVRKEEVSAPVRDLYDRGRIRQVPKRGWEINPEAFRRAVPSGSQRFPEPQTAALGSPRRGEPAAGTATGTAKPGTANANVQRQAPVITEQELDELFGERNHR